MMKQFILILLIPFLLIGNAYSYKASDIKTINIIGTDLMESVYTIPEGQDLVITKMYGEKNTTLALADQDGQIIAGGNFHDQNFYELDIAFTNEVQALGNTGMQYNLFGYLISEDEDLKANESVWTKHIFDKADIDYIYKIEFTILIILAVLKLFYIVIYRK